MSASLSEISFPYVVPNVVLISAATFCFTCAVRSCPIASCGRKLDRPNSMRDKRCANCFHAHSWLRLCWSLHFELTGPIRSRKFGPSNQPPTPHLMPYVLFSRVSDVSRPVAATAVLECSQQSFCYARVGNAWKHTSVDIDVLVGIGTVSVAWVGAV